MDNDYNYNDNNSVRTRMMIINLIVISYSSLRFLFCELLCLSVNNRDEPDKKMSPVAYPISLQLVTSLNLSKGDVHRYRVCCRSQHKTLEENVNCDIK